MLIDMYIFIYIIVACSLCCCCCCVAGGADKMRCCEGC